MRMSILVLISSLQLIQLASTDESLYSEEIDAQAMEKLNEERRMEKVFAVIDRNISRSGSTVTKHRQFTATRRRSVNRGRAHRLRVLRAMVSAMSSSSRSSRQPRVPEEEITCVDTSPYRTADGSCNNLYFRSWGRAGAPMRRWLPPQYDDGMMSPRTASRIQGTQLPSARKISTVVHHGPGVQQPHLPAHDTHTHMLMQWGQFLDHDITGTPMMEIPEGLDGIISPACCDSKALLNASARPECFPIDIPVDDTRSPATCMEFVRSVQIENSERYVLPVEQMNEITAYIDASQVYGVSDEEQRHLRSFSEGKLRENKDLLPRDYAETPSCATPTAPNHCFKAGDGRVNENPTLQGMHTVFLREHNRVAGNLSEINPKWNDEKLFQETRKIVGALMQKITYDEYLPLILGPRHMSQYKLSTKQMGFSSGYKWYIDASIRNAFATAAFRMGHSMIRPSLTSVDNNYETVAEDQLRNTFGDTSFLLSSGRTVGSLCRGLLKDSVMNVDMELTDEITDHLFPDSNGISLDLSALNIQRGRDHGLPSYTAWRRFCRVAMRTKNFCDLDNTHSEEAIARLKSVYDHVEDVDLFPGALSETPVAGGMVGPTLACLMGKQFRELKRGDRFWFEQGDSVASFTEAQLQELRKATLSRIICDNTDTTNIQKEAFTLGERVPCNQLDEIDLTKW